MIIKANLVKQQLIKKIIDDRLKQNGPRKLVASNASLLNDDWKGLPRDWKAEPKTWTGREEYIHKIKKCFFTCEDRKLHIHSNKNSTLWKSDQKIRMITITVYTLNEQRAHAAFEDKRIKPTILTAANKIKRNIKRTNLQRLNVYYKDLQLSE